MSTLDSAQYRNILSNNQQKAKRQNEEQTIKTTKKASGRKELDIKTHLTIIGVCTTTFPEKSGT
jgi:hypothetical protein